MEEAHGEDVYDDWFIDSIKRYKDLHVFQLESPTQVIEWTSAKTVCVAGFTPSRNEILELRLPLKLFAEENKGLCAERDFKVVHGGFTDGPVSGLRHIPGTRCIVTCGGRSNELQVWDLGGDDSDVIRRTGSIERKTRGEEEEVRRTKLAARPWSKPQVLHGSQISNIQLSDVSSGQTVYNTELVPADPLSSLQFVSDAVFLAAASNGNLYLCDIRSSAPPCHTAAAGESIHWWTEASATGRSSCRVLRVSAEGRAVVSDLRNLQEAVCQVQLEVHTPSPSDPEDVCLSWAPVLDGLIAVSGFGTDVQIYDSTLWTSETQEVQPLFEHQGHKVSSDAGIQVSVTTHVWHSERPRTLLSAASDGSIHVWDWVDLC